MRQRNLPLGIVSLQQRPDPELVGWIGIGMEQTNRNRLHMVRFEERNQCRDIGIVEWGNGLLVKRGALVDLAAQCVGDEWGRAGLVHVVERWAIAPPNHQHIAEAGGGNQGRHRTPPLEQGVGGDSGAMDEDSGGRM
jgi:hypothetical protein